MWKYPTRSLAFPTGIITKALTKYFNIVNKDHETEIIVSNEVCVLKNRDLFLGNE